MTMKLSILLSANGKEAKAEVKAIESALAKMGTTAKTSSGKTKNLTQSTKTLDAAVGQAKVEVQQLSAAQVRNAATAGQMSAANRTASGSIGNLTAQFNDIGVMLAAGQNPLQLAIQQGTQISQVLGPMGAAGAGKALLGGLKAMISPMSLLTIGTIAGGAALFQWATKARDAAGDMQLLEERLKGVTEAQRALNGEIRQASLGVTAEELTLTDAIAVKKREIAALEGEILAGLQRGRSNAPRELQIAQQQLEAQQAQLETLRAQQIAKETLTQSASEMAANERLLGEQMLQTGAQLAENEAIANLLKDGISASVIEAMQLAGVDISSPISTAASDAARLADNLSIAYGEAVKISYERSRSYTSSGRGGDPRDFETGGTLSGRYTPSAEALAGANNILNPKRVSVSSGGGGTNKVSETEREQKAIDDLIASLREQQDVIRTTDPVQKEMIQNRKVLANATKAEKATVEELISARLREEAAVSQATERADFYGNVLSSALDTATQSGAKLDDVLKNIAGSLIDATIQAAIFGSGPFGNIFGGVGIFGGAAAPQALAAGGMIYGAGGGRDDKVPVMGSAGEFIVNAKATAANRNLLEAINAGAPIQGLAKGGAIGGGSAPQSSGTGGGDVIHIHVDVTGANGNTEIMQMVAEGVSMGIEQYDRHALPSRVSEISQNPRMVG